MPSLAYQKLKETKALPSPTGVALEILRLASDENATLEAITAAAAADPALVGRLLKLVNSPFAGLPRRIASVSVAVRLLGMRTVKNLALGLALVSNNRSGRCQAFDYETFWSESLARAVAAGGIANQRKDFSPDEAFTAGLLSKVGRLALATACPDEYARMPRCADPENVGALLEMEHAAFGINHNELSAEMLADWGLQDIFCEAVRGQDRPNARNPGTETRGDQLTRILHLAGSVASVLAQPQAGRESLTALVSEAGGLGIPGEAFQQLFDALGDEWRQAGTIFSVSTREVPPLVQLCAQTRPGGGTAGEQSPRAGAAQKSPTPRADAVRILIVDDDPAALRLLERHLSTAGYRVTTAATGVEALEIDRAQTPQMIITDWMMPGMDGLELCRRLREHEEIGFVYLIVLTASIEENRVVEALEAGADDFLTKPYNRPELLARVRAGERIVRLESNLAERSREVSRYNARLAATNDQLRVMATTDELTGLANRREALVRLAEHWSLAVRHGDPLSYIVADIDHFKRFNDAHGHDLGDVVLKATAEVLRKTARAGEAVCRIGGEEFLLICPRSTASSAEIAAERVRSAVASNVINCNGTELSVTLSLGVAERTESTHSPDELLKAADQALYAAKRAGRDCVCVAGQGPTPHSTQPEHSRATELRPPVPPQEPGGAPIRVLIVADDAQTRALCRRILEREGYVVSDASNGLDVLEKAPACSPDVIVMDALPPSLDGLECTRRLKASAATKEVPIIMLSVASEAESIEAGLEAGVYDAQLFVSAPLVSKTMLAGDRVVGVLNITDRHGQRPFTAGELESIALLCNVAATAINDFMSRPTANTGYKPVPRRTSATTG